MQPIRDAILAGAPGDELAALPLPESYRAAVVLASEQDMFEGIDSDDKDPRKSLHIQEVAVPELAPDEAVIAVMASSINFNTVWTSIFEPLPTFGFLKRLGKESAWGARHDQPFHVVGSDASGVVLRVGSAVRKWRPGDRVVVHCNYVDDQDPSSHNDSMLAGQPAHLGVRDQLRRARRSLGREGQPAHAQAGPPQLGGGGGQRAVQLHQLPHAGQLARRRA